MWLLVLSHSVWRVPHQRLRQRPRAALRRSHVRHRCRHRRQRQRRQADGWVVWARRECSWRVPRCRPLQPSRPTVFGEKCGVVMHHGYRNLWIIRAGSTQLILARGLALDGSGDLLIADTKNHRVQVCPADNPGVGCATVVGTGTARSGAAELYNPYDVVLDRAGDHVVVDHGNHRIQLCAASNPQSACGTVAGTRIAGSAANQFNAVALDSHGDYAVLDHWNHRVHLCPAASPGTT